MGWDLGALAGILCGAFILTIGYAVADGHYEALIVVALTIMGVLVGGGR